MANVPKTTAGQSVSPATGSKLAVQAAQPAPNAVVPVKVVYTTNFKDDNGNFIVCVLLKNGTCAYLSEDQLM